MRRIEAPYIWLAYQHQVSAIFVLHYTDRCTLAMILLCVRRGKPHNQLRGKTKDAMTAESLERRVCRPPSSVRCFSHQ